jgi:hypothetical protein
MDASSPTYDPVESERRKPGATGTPAVLADGQTWLLANPVYRAGLGTLTEPAVDGPLDRAFESAVLNEGLSLCDVWLAGRALLRANYELSDGEVARLLTVSPGENSRSLANAVLEALLGSERRERTYTAWVRASLLANGLGMAEIPAADITNVLAILAATNRTIPLSRFADACRVMDERARLETLI